MYELIFRPLSRAFALCAAVLALAMPHAVSAQNGGSAETELYLLERLSVTKLEDMDFGAIVETGGGTVVMNPLLVPTCTASANITHTGACQPAVFGGAGSTGRFINIIVPPGRTITLTGPGNNMTINPVTVSGSPDLQYWFRWNRSHIHRIVSPTGNFLFRVGGTLQVGANQAPGLYTGTFDIRVDYY